MSGHKDPEDCIDPEERQDMADRDEKALEAIEGIFSALVNAERITMRLELLGSKRAKSDFYSVKKSIDSYLSCVLEDAQTSGIFRAKTFSSTMEEIDKLLANLTRNAKEDLGL